MKNFPIIIFGDQKFLMYYSSLKEGVMVPRVANSQAPNLTIIGGLVAPDKIRRHSKSQLRAPNGSKVLAIYMSAKFGNKCTGMKFPKLNIC